MSRTVTAASRLAEAGCYAWTMDAADTDAPTLEVSQLFAGTGTDVLAFQRDLAGESSVVVVLNNEDNDVELSSLNGGLSVGGTFADGAVIEITGADNNLSVAGGRLIGTVPARTTYLVSQAGTDPGDDGIKGAPRCGAPFFLVPA